MVEERIARRLLFDFFIHAFRPTLYKQSQMTVLPRCYNCHFYRISSALHSG
jgi:hypothetical protein